MVEDHVARQWPAERWHDVDLLVACSGGPDSTAVLRALLGLVPHQPARITIAHFNHHWRGEESDGDQLFVEGLAAHWNLTCFVGHPAAGSVARDEATARQMRYDFLHRTAHQIGARHIVLGHTADDQAETILHRILRGTGLTGLAGMSFVRPLTADMSLIRPILGLRRDDVLAYLHRLGQPYRCDRSNEDLGYTRNRIRLQLLPMLRREYNLQVDDALVQLGELARGATDELRQRLLACHASAVLEQSPQSVRIACQVLRQLTPADQSEFFRLIWQQQEWPQQAMGYRQWRVLVELLQAEPRSATLPGEVHARRRGDDLLLTGARSPIGPISSE